MNKAHRLTVAPDGSVEEDKLRFLLDMSHELTKSKKQPLLF
jgi:predicted DNA-binding protein (MmcQ/YjbR family)